MRDVNLTFTTNGSGAATATTAVLPYCRLVAIEWLDGDLADGVDAVFKVTGRASGIDRTILTLTDANADAFYNVTNAVVSTAGAAVTDGWAHPIIDGKVTVTVADGGSVKTGGAILFLE